MADEKTVGRLDDAFDGVIFLTGSHWPTEPRSNRYHYATRFARRLPVYFVQPDSVHPEWTCEPSGHPNITLVHVSQTYDFDETQTELGITQAGAPTGLKAFLRAHNIRRPLLWVYNYLFEPLLAACPEQYKVFHATEDYTLGADTVRYHNDAGRALALRSLNHCDLLVAVSDAVRENYVRAADFRGPAITLNNGCDFSFWQSHNGGAFEPDPPRPAGLWDRLRGRPPSGPIPVAFFQGGINNRLDFPMLRDLVRRMPDWKFSFCGPVVTAGLSPADQTAWREILGSATVAYHGMVTPERIAELSKAATVGIAPFKDTRFIYISLPLKAYEYVACGLPVVTVPIRALESRPDLFAMAQGAEQFEAAIRAAAPSRADPARVANRLQAAKAMDYDARFDELEVTLLNLLGKAHASRKKLNVLVLYDDAFSHVKTIQEHLRAFSNHSKHNYFFIPASDTPSWDMFPAYEGRWPAAWDLDMFDAVVWHYGLPASLPDYLSSVVGERLARYDGLKVLFIQDEYENTSTISNWIRKAGISLVMTCVPPEGVEFVYPAAEHPGVEFLQTLTGFVPEDEDLDRHIVPMSARESRIGYRGRVLPFHYGTLGYEKHRIGAEVRRLAGERNIPVDIEVDDSKRIYGEEWYRFLGSVRATLGTESGSNVFDFDGALKRQAAQAQADGVAYLDFFAKYLVDKEGHVTMNQVSPKFFEAIRLRTALVCFEGEYSGVIRVNEHFIPLKKDFSNIDEVFEKLDDIEFLEGLTARAYRDIIESDRYSYGDFVERFDRILSSRVMRPARAEIISAPIVKRRRGQEAFEAVPHASTFEYILNDGVLRSPLQRRALESLLEGGPTRPTLPPVGPPAHASVVADRSAKDVRCYDFWKASGASLALDGVGAVIQTPAQPWHYAAVVDLDLSKVDLGAPCWLKITLRDVEPGMLISLFNLEDNSLKMERMAPAGRGPIELGVEVTDPNFSILLFRNSDQAAPSRATFIQAQIVS